MKVKVSEASKIQLDWMVDKIEGRFGLLGCYSPSTDWAIAGPIIERDGCFPKLEKPGLYVANIFNGVAYVHTQFGFTLLGDEGEVPEEVS